MRRTQRKVLSILLSLAMLCSLAVPTAFATDNRYSDTTDHWAEAAIGRWSDYGIVEGYGDAFNPDNAITRAQMATILSKTLGLTETTENPFSDVYVDEWYTPYVLRCYKADIMLGDNGKANPNAEITRQEAMTMFCRAFAIQADEKADLTAFKDSGKVSDWALPYVSALINSGIVSGVSSDMLAPADKMSRAALVTVLDRAVVQYINTSGEYDLTDKEGIILVAAGDTTLKGETKADVLITQAADEKAVTFKDATVTGAVTVQGETKIVNNNSKLPEIDAEIELVKAEEEKKTTRRRGGSSGSSAPVISDLTISEEKAVTSGTYNNVTITDAVADGEVTLSNITINGDLTINGGGSSSIKLVGCTIQGKVIMAKESGAVPRLELTNTPITAVEVQKPAIIEAVDRASAVTKIETTANIEIKGENTKVDTLAIAETAENVVAVNVSAGNVATVEAKAETTVTGASNAVNTIIATAAVTADSAAVQKVEIPETATESVSITVAGTEAVDVEINSTNGVAVTGTNVTVSTTLETAPDNITVGGTAVTHIHKWGEPVTTPASCEQDGENVYTCIADGCDDTAKTKTEVIIKLGHNYGDWKLSDNDLHVRECANDKEHYEKQEHTWDEGKITTEANCGQEGVKTYTCSVCKGTKTETIGKPEHNWGDWVKVDATSHKRVCKNNATHIETADHTPIIDSAVDATCTETGKTEGSHCDICNSVIIEQTTTPTLTHDFTGEYEKDADGHWHICERDNCEETDTKAGHTYNTTNCAEVATCTVCGYEKAAGEHTWGEWVKVDEENHKHTCPCSATETAGHKWDDGIITTDPTPTNAGVKTYTCSVCKGTKTESLPYVPKKEINFSKIGNSIRVEWSGYTASKYIFRLFDEEGNKVSESAETSRTYDNDISIYMPVPDTGVNKYKFVLYSYSNGVTTELDSVEDAITVTVGTDAVDYEIAYNATAENEHSITWKNNIAPSGIKYIGIWKNANGTHNEKISGAISQYGIVHRKYGYQNLTFDLRVISSADVSDGKIAITITPPSEKKYSETTSNVRLMMEGDYLYLVFDDEEGLGVNEWYYVLQNGENITSEDLKEIELTWLLPGISENTVLNYEIQKGTWQTKETFVKLDNAINITVTDSAPNLSLVPQEDGTYKITGGGDTGYFYRVTAPDGERLATDYTIDDTFLCSIYEGCTVELQTGTIKVAENGLSANITMSPVVKIENPTLPTGLNTVVEVDTADELLDAVNKGAIATLTADITSENVFKFKTGAPATIDLNGHTLTAPNTRAYYGKELVIDATEEGSAIVGNVTVQLYGKLTLNGGTYSKIRVTDGRGFVANGITVESTDSSYALEIGYSDYVEINNSSCISTSNSDYATALYIWRSKDINLNNVTASVTGNSFAADIAYCEKVNITGGSFSAENTDGLRFVECEKATIDGASVSGSTVALLVQDVAVAEINGGTFTSAGNSAIQLSREDSALTINNGTFIANGDGSIKNIVIMEDTNTFIINGGTFEGFSGVTYSDTATASINGGTFSFDPTEYVDSATHTVTDNADGTYTVTEKLQ
ncbi:MAG: S-layer homology domain-containing protein [Clostridia bacterium]|nr:S-layer homology domain-containing protein [Clostridia bacterium]